MDAMKKVSPAHPVAPWRGGKLALHSKIIARIDAIEHQTYAEPFVGMGGVFLRRTWVPKLEVANDLNNEITNLFRVLQLHYVPLIDFMKWQLTSRQEFERLSAQDPSRLTDLQRAARFIYLQRLNFGGKPGDVFGVARDRPPRFQLSKVEPLLEEAHTRLQNVTLESLPWQELLARYDGDGTLFYLDPPYWGGETDYGKDMFSRDDFAEMAELLGRLKGTFVLSINDVPEIRALFDGFHFEEVKLTYTVSQSAGKEAAELIISNREPVHRLL